MTSSDPFLRALGMAIRRLRHGQGVSQEALALAGGLDRSYVGHIEAGRRNIGVITLRAVATGLAVELSELVAEAERIHAELH